MKYMQKYVHWISCVVWNCFLKSGHNLYRNQKHPTAKGVSKDQKRSEMKMGDQGLCSVTADGNKILI